MSQNFIISKCILLFDQLSTVEIQELLLMEAEMAVSSHLVELSDMNVVRDIDYQDLLIEHVKHQENGLVIKLCVKVKLYRKYDFYDWHKRKFI